MGSLPAAPTTKWVLSLYKHLFRIVILTTERRKDLKNNQSVQSERLKRERILAKNLQIEYNLINLPRQALSLGEYAGEVPAPVNLVDPEGRKIYFAKGVPEWFKERYYATIEYMKETGTYDLVFRTLEEDDNFVVYIDYIETINKENRIGYSPPKNRIYWNPNAFIKNTNGTYTFPATILAHEGVHALQDMTFEDNYDIFIGLHNTKDPEYDNLLEKEVIKNYEWSIARMHGDIEENQVTWKSPVCVTPEAQVPLTLESMFRMTPIKS